jgi:SAM-dependent methyltransferase
MPDEPIARAGYDQLADAYAAQVAAKPHNAFYDRPALLALLPAVAHRHVLDAGCGSGIYTEWLVNHGATVLALDVSPRMVAHAQARLQDRATIREADLSQPLDFLPAAAFDLIVSALVLDYVRDWDRLFADFFRLLRAPGHFVFSVGHPSAEFYEQHPDGNYFQVEAVEATFDWPAFGVHARIPYYRRPLSAMLDSLLGAGFRLERLVEPRPTVEFQIQDPQNYTKLLRQPGFICFRACKDAAQPAHLADDAPAPGQGSMP